MAQTKLDNLHEEQPMVITDDLLAEIARLNIVGEKSAVKELGHVSEEGADIADFSLWKDMFEEVEGQGKGRTYSCLKTQKRRDLKMKKHRRAKRKKVMLLKLKASGKL